MFSVQVFLVVVAASSINFSIIRPINHFISGSTNARVVLASSLLPVPSLAAVGQDFQVLIEDIKDAVEGGFDGISTADANCKANANGV